MIIFNGKKLSDNILQELKTETDSWPQKPAVAVFSFGDKNQNSSYIIQKKKAADFLGFGFKQYHYSEADFSKSREYLNKIAKMKNISAVVVQMPLPAGVNNSIVNVVPPEKDPDLLSDKSVGLFFNGRALVEPPTPTAILKILNEAGISARGKRAAIFGYGRLVGRFLVPMFIKEGATVSILEKDIPKDQAAEISSKADIIVTATGQAKFLTSDMVKEDAAVIDAGFSLGIDGKIYGDVDLDSVKDKVSLLTPVPGGVGPVGVAQLFSNIVKLYKRHQYTDAPELRE